MNKGLFKKVLVGASLLLVGGLAMAGGDDLAGVANTLKGNFEALAQLVTAGSYLAGLGFAVGAVLKFKQHKDNPTQIPVGTPIAMLFVAVALLFLPMVLKVAGKSVFGSDLSTTGVEGTADILGE